MDNIKDKVYFVNKVLDNLYKIQEFTKNVSLDDFTHNELLQSAVCFLYIQVYENAKNLDFKDFEKNFEKTIILLRGFRNLIVHEYGKIDVISVYNTSINNVPEFIKLLEKQIK